MKVQIGSSPRRLVGWCNVDGDPVNRPDVVADAVGALPFPDESVAFLYSGDFIERVELARGRAFLAECHRVLRPDGWMRLLTPDFGVAVHHFYERNPDILARHRRRLGVRTRAELVNDAMRRGGRAFVYDEETLLLALREASFGARPTAFNASQRRELCGLDVRDDGTRLHLDCWKLPAGEIELPAWDAAAIARLWHPWRDLRPQALADGLYRLESLGSDAQLLGPLFALPRDRPLWCVLELGAVAERDERLQLFWRGEREDFDLERMVEMPLRCDGEVRSIGLALGPAAPGACQLRLDPLGQPGSVSLRSISICEAPAAA